MDLWPSRVPAPPHDPTAPLILNAPWEGPPPPLPAAALQTPRGLPARASGITRGAAGAEGAEVSGGGRPPLIGQQLQGESRDGGGVGGVMRVVVGVGPYGGGLQRAAAPPATPTTRQPRGPVGSIGGTGGASSPAAFGGSRHPLPAPSPPSAAALLPPLDTTPVDGDWAAYLPCPWGFAAEAGGQGGASPASPEGAGFGAVGGTEGGEEEEQWRGREAVDADAAGGSDSSDSFFSSPLFVPGSGSGSGVDLGFGGPGAGARAMEGVLALRRAGVLGAEGRGGARVGESGGRVGMLPTLRPAFLDRYEVVPAVKRKRATPERLDALTAEEKEERRRRRAKVYSANARKHAVARQEALARDAAAMEVFQMIVDTAPIVLLVLSVATAAIIQTSRLTPPPLPPPLAVTTRGDAPVILFANDAAARLLHWDPSELLMRTVWDVIHPADRPAVRAAYEDLLLSGPRAGQKQQGEEQAPARRASSKRAVHCRLQGCFPDSAVDGEARLSYGTQGIIFSFWPSISTPPPATATLPTPLPLHRQPTNAPAAARRLTAILKSQEAAATAAGAKAGAKAGRGASPVPVPAPTRKAPFLKGPAAKGAGREGDESGATTASSSSSSDESTGGGGDDDGSGLLAPFPVLAAADADAAPRLSALSLGPLEGAGAGVGKVAMECAIPEWYTEEKTDEVAGDPGADGVGTPWPGLGPFVF